MQEFDIKYVALYLRKSRADSDEDLAKHRAILIELCTKHNYKYVEYAEIGTSDSIDMREKMLELLRDIEDDMYDAVCVVDYDRLGRGDQGEQDRIRKAFQKSGTLIITPDKVYDLNNDSDDTYIDFKGFLARQEYKMISRRLRQGKKVGAKLGQWTNGTPPYPYEYQSIKPKGVTVNKEKLVHYRYMIESILSGKSTTAIANELNKQHIPAARGGVWHSGQIYRLVLDEVHLGYIVSGKSAGDGHKRKKPNSKPLQSLNREDWIIVEGSHEAVKTLEEHEQIKELLITRQNIPYRGRESVYALSNLVKCGLCGHTHSFLTKPTEVVLMKPCWYKDPYGVKCTNKGVKLSVIEELVLSEVNHYKDHFLIENNEAEVKQKGVLLLQLTGMEQQLNKYQKALDVINESYEMGDISRTEWLSRREKRNNDIRTIQSTISEIKRQLKSLELVKSEDKLANIEAFLESIEAVASPKERNELYSMIIDKIIWTRTSDDEANIIIEYK